MPDQTASTSNDSPDHIAVMLVDDSAVVRGILTRILESDPHIKIIESVQNGDAPVSALTRVKPDVLLLDIEMPVMDGITALPLILKESPSTKVIMCSTLTQKGADITLEAMKLGAVDCIGKPSSNKGLREGDDFQDHLVQMVRALGPELSPTARPAKRDAARPPPKLTPEEPIQLHKDAATYMGKPSIVAIGSSTGGPQALFNVIKDCKGFDIPIVITQHMPATFTKILADHITQQTGVPTHEGEEGMVVENGNAYVAPGGLHMVFEKQGTDLVIKLDDGPAESFCKPSVDTMYRSLFEIYGNKMLIAILTGMGHDGLNESKRLVGQGVRLVAQDKDTSVVWGMPGAVAQAGICTDILPVDQIGPYIRKAVTGR